jgi:spore germination protein Q
MYYSYNEENRAVYPQYMYGGNIPGYQYYPMPSTGGGAIMPSPMPSGTEFPQPTQIPAPPGQVPQPAQIPAPGQLPLEQSYIENILRLNRGKLAHVHMTFNHEGGSKSEVFTGIIEAAGRDHIILSDPQTGKRYLLLMVYLDYVTFDEPIEYSYPIDQMATYSSR